MTGHTPDLKALITGSQYLDVHNHMDAYPLAERKRVAARVHSEKILCFSAGTDSLSWAQNDRFSTVTPYIISCFGIHPWMAHKYSPSDIEAAEEQYASSVMINEIGLDTVWADSEATLYKQESLLQAQLSLAEKLNKPVTLHTKGAEQQVLDILRQYKLPGILIHWYDGPRKLIDSFLGLGCYFTVPPAFINKAEYRKLISRIPTDRLLPETDNPSTWPWLFKEPGKPEQIREIYHAYGKWVGKNRTIVHNQFQENLLRFFFRFHKAPED